MKKTSIKKIACMLILLGNAQYAYTMDYFRNILGTVYELFKRSATPEPAAPASFVHIPLNDWIDNCARIQHGKEHADSPIEYEWFCYLYNAYLWAIQDFLTLQNYWLDNVMPPAWESLDSRFETFTLYVQKLIVPTTARIIFHGDVHGDVSSLLACIKKELIDTGRIDQQTWRLCDANDYCIFLGDYTDRGCCGAEVIATLLMLKIANPHRVFMVRGNHEHKLLNDRYGFTQELKIKFSDQEVVNDLIRRSKLLYNSLPSAIDIGCEDGQGGFDFVVGCHGGIEIGYNPSRLLQASPDIHYEYIPHLDRAAGYTLFEHSVPAKLQQPWSDVFNRQRRLIPSEINNGLAWADFFPDDFFLKPSARGVPVYDCGKQPTLPLLQAWSCPLAKVRLMFRGHQHSLDRADWMRRRILNDDYASNPEDAGVGVIWTPVIEGLSQGLPQEPSVITFSATPGGGVDWPFASYGVLTVGQGYSHWRLFVQRII